MGSGRPAGPRSPELPHAPRGQRMREQLCPCPLLLWAVRPATGSCRLQPLGSRKGSLVPAICLDRAVDVPGLFGGAATEGTVFPTMTDIDGQAPNTEPESSGSDSAPAPGSDSAPAPGSDSAPAPGSDSAPDKPEETDAELTA